MRKAILATTVLSAALAACGTVPSEMDPADRYITDAAGNQVLSASSGECIRNAASSVGDSESCHKKEVAPEPVAVPEPKKPVYESIKVSANALFGFDSAVVTAAGQSKLAELVEELRSFNAIDDIIVVGHTDSVGSAAYNQRLSEKRAMAVKSVLDAADLGVSISAMGKGEANPVATNQTADGRAQNRRVEVLVSGSREAN